MNSRIVYGEMQSPVGPIILISSEKGLCRVHFGTVEESLPTLTAWCKKHFIYPQLIFQPDELQEEMEQLSEFFSGERKEFQIRIDQHGTPFQIRVWEELSCIKYGETKSYKEIAQLIHAPKAVRAIGNAVNRNPLPIIVPCHRVIGSNGALVGYNGGLEKKEKLLYIENSLEKIS